MADIMYHRGPDDGGFFFEGPVALAHRRLSIIDLSDGGSQPMHSADGSLVIVYNGELYNYVELREELRRSGRRFHSESDTEVILEAYRQWGPACVTRFNGMWALALYDRTRHELFLSRDRFGIKPLYYIQDDARFGFASEIKGLLAAFPSCGAPIWRWFITFCPRVHWTTDRRPSSPIFARWRRRTMRCSTLRAASCVSGAIGILMSTHFARVGVAATLSKRYASS